MDAVSAYVLVALVRADREVRKHVDAKTSQHVFEQQQLDADLTMFDEIDMFMRLHLPGNEPT